VPYGLVWPGTLKNVKLDRALHARPVEFTSPVFGSDEGEARNYSRVAFEADLPRIESNTNPPCQRHLSNPADPNPGQDCVNPPKGVDFYPIFTTAKAGEEEDSSRCIWHLGGPYLPETTNTFGGNSAAEYGPLLQLAYPAVGGQVTIRLNDFRRVLPYNPCASRVGRD